MTRSRGASLNRRVNLAVVGVTSLVVLIAASVVWLITESILLKGVDRELLSRVERYHKYPYYASPLFWHEVASRPELKRRFERAGPGERRRVVGIIVSAKDNTELMRSPSLSPEFDFTLPILPTVNRKSKPVIKTVMVPLLINSDNPDNESQINGQVGSELPKPKVMRVLGIHLQNDPTIPFSDQIAESDFAHNSSRDGRDWSLYLMQPRFLNDPEAATGVFIYFALDMEQIQDELNRMWWMLAGMWGAATIFSLITIRLLHPSVLRPARELTSAISEMGPDDLTRRLPDNIGPVELHGVVERLNSLFATLELAFKREQATIANIAHELRTPVASLRSALEFRQMASTDADEQAAIRGYLDTVERMQTQVSNLLLLARLEAGKEPLQRTEVALVDLLDEAVDRWQPRAMLKQQTITSSVTNDAVCLTSPDHVGLMLDNLIGNAVAHGVPNSEITLSCQYEDRHNVVTITNTFSGTLDTHELGQAYYRGDSARSRDDHCGLGLALCQRLAKLLHVRLQLTGTDGRFVATIHFPSEKPAAADKAPN